MTDLETLRKLRDAAPAEPINRIDLMMQPGSAQFYRAAHAALGPDGCVTKELERAQAHVEEVAAAGRDRHRLLSETIAERDSLKDEVKRLRESVLRLADSHANDLSHPLTSADTLAIALHELLDVKKEAPASVSKSTSTLSPCPRCGETVPTTFKAGVLTYQCLKCAEDA